jgi:hypothetical protein
MAAASSVQNVRAPYDISHLDIEQPKDISTIDWSRAEK